MGAPDTKRHEQSSLRMPQDQQISKLPAEMRAEWVGAGPFLAVEGHSVRRALEPDDVSAAPSSSAKGMSGDPLIINGTTSHMHNQDPREEVIAMHGSMEETKCNSSGSASCTHRSEHAQDAWILAEPRAEQQPPQVRPNSMAACRAFSKAIVPGKFSASGTVS
jgi:hypothetical protein